MALTLIDLKERLKSIDEISLLELLGITSEDLVERFYDLIEDKYDELVPDFEAEESDD